jgi:hypothetical protein
MYRALLPLVVGATGGALLTYYLTREAAPPSPAAQPPPIRAAAAPAPAGAGSGKVTAERAEAYRLAADADAATLERLLARAAARPASAEREFALGVLLVRLTEIDAERAAELARRSGASDELLADVYAAWARSDPAGALAGLAGIDAPGLATALALAMLPALGGDEHALNQLLAALPPRAERAFRLTSLADLAERSPADAFEQSLAMDDAGMRGIAIERVAAAWARIDARAALARIEDIDDEQLRSTFHVGVLREWARFDTDGIFEYFAALDPANLEELAGIGMFEAARMEPERAFEFADTLPPAIARNMRQSAVRALGERDPVTALRYLDRLPIGQRQQLRQTIARSYGQKQPDAALEWARASGSAGDLSAVLGGIAQRDPNRALDVALALPGARERATAVQSVAAALGNVRGADAVTVADRLVALADEPVRNVGMTRLMQAWPTREPERALDWLMTNAQRAPAAAFQGVARVLGATDPAAAARYYAQVPADMRQQWLQSAAQSYAQTDPLAARDWVAQYRGEPGHVAATAAVAQNLARVDAPAAAQLLDSIAAGPQDPGSLGAAARAVAGNWAQSQPLAAAEWAAQLRNGAGRSTALAASADAWASKDYAAARDWTMRLTAGEARDVALGSLLGNSAAGELDSALIAAFSTAAARERAVLNALRTVGARNPAEARTLIDRYIASPAQREQAERILEQARVLPPLPPVF